MPESDLVSPVSSNQLPMTSHHPGDRDHPHNFNYGNNNNPQQNTQYFNNSNDTSQFLNRSINPMHNNNNHQSSAGTPGSNNHSMLNSNDQNNNSNNNANEIRSVGPPTTLPPERRDLFEEIRNGGGHWSQLLRQVVLRIPSDLPYDKVDDIDSESQLVPIEIDGGSENGQFVYVGHVNSDINAWIAVGYLQSGDLLLDIQGQQVAGYTQADVLSLLHHCLRGNSVTLTVAPRGSLGPELRSYLNTRFQKGSVDHALQGVVRDNLYLRTVPVTTRQPRPGEINGVDYTFLSAEEFMELERNGSLLESGVYAGNHYGTPKPWASRLRSTNPQFGSNEGGQPLAESSKGSILPGMHPSSEGKRRRNRSNVEALGAGDDEPSSSNINSPTHSATIPTYSPRYQPPEDELGPLPSNWEMAYTEKGEVYFIDHNTGTSHWLDPRLSRVQKMTLEDCDDNELPFGWERIDDPHYGTYYIDHVNRRTQFENPVIKAKQSKSLTNSPTEGGDTLRQHMGPPKNVGFPPRYSSTNPPPPNPKPVNPNRLSVPRGKTPVDLSPDQHINDSHSALTPYINHSTMPSMNSSNELRVKSTDRPSNRFFTRDPLQLVGERISTVLMKSSRGLGFTIVGGDDDDGLDEFLQIKSVVADGPAWRDAKLRTGDVLVRVNGINVLGYTHQEMVSIFQSISPGEDVHLDVCRGYPLPFDPADPNTEIVTTVAVAPFNPENGDKRQLDWLGRPSTPDSAHSLPELSGDRIGYGKSTTGRPASVDLLLDSPTHGHRSDKNFSKHTNIETGTFLTVTIDKGTAGFGFTIADSVTGQKVKKVLDPTHCGGLEEGDRLIAIDGIDLRGLSHTQVVQILKDFPLGRDASLTIQRIHSHQFNQKFSPIPSNNYTDSRVILTNRPGMSPRSKTPTADLGRGRPRLRDSLPERPKTPVFDTGGQYNGHNGMYNGDIAFQPNPAPIQNSHSFLPSERYPISQAGQNNNLPIESGELNTAVSDYAEMTIELQRRQEGFGFRIVGGTEEGSQVSVGHIVPRGAAALDGRLQTNDQLIAVDNVSVIGASHHSVVQLMARAASAHRVRLSIRRPIYSNNPTISDGVGSPSHSPAINSPLHVTLKRQPSEGFGFVIISSASKAGATIGRIVEGSPADRCTQLHVGDRILAVNQTEISQLHHSQVVQLIKDSGLLLTLTVLPMGGTDNQIQHQAQLSPSNPSNMITSDLENLGLKENHGYDIGTAFIHPESQPVHFGSNHSGSSSYPDSVEQVFSVQLSRGARGFGFSIRGGKEFQNMPLFVLRLAEDGPATIDGRMQVGDQILQINGINTHGMTHSQAIHLIKTGGSSVHLLLRRGAVPIPYLNQMPNFSSSSGFVGMNGQEEEQSVSSNNDTLFVGQTSPIYRDHHHKSSYPPQM